MGCGGCGKMTRAEKVKSIITGWTNVVWKDEATEEEAIRRVGICAECNHNKIAICKVCACFIPAKARSMAESCPINKWNE